MKTVNCSLMILSTFAFAGVMLPVGGPFAVVFFAVFCLWPYGVQVVLVKSFPTLAAQVVLALATLLYAAWFGYVYLDAMVWRLDPQSAILFLFTGIYALPGLLPLWVMAGVLEWRLGRRD